VSGVVVARGGKSIGATAVGTWLTRRVLGFLLPECSFLCYICSGDVVTIDNKGGQKDFVNTIKVGGGEQQMDSADGMVPVLATWGSDGSLVMQTELMGCKVTMARKRTDAKTVVLEISDGKGLVAKRIFTKQ
jgi:hypothetical protein